MDSEIKTPHYICNSTELLFVMYEVHKQIEGENAEEFEKFLHWGSTIVSDFDELDKYPYSGKPNFL